MMSHSSLANTDQKQKLWANTVRLSLFLTACASIITLILNWKSNPIRVELIPFQGQIFEGLLELRFDTLSMILLLMVSTLGTLISHYAYRYLDGEPQQSYFYRWLLLTLASVSILITSNHLITLFLAWFSTSLSLNQLLIYYRNKPNAQKAAFKKFVVSRTGDLFIMSAIALIYHQFHTLHLDQIFQDCRALSSTDGIDFKLSLSAILLVLGALTKSAQFPFHFWLPETMETPTVVSALMHAGVINAGGFLVIRLNPILQLEPLAGILLTIMGCITAVFASLVMITQNDIKKKLAYSTICQMGMMMTACGLGAYSLALFHIVMHSFYKAHAFLSTGMIVEESKKISLKPKKSSLVVLTSIFLGTLLLTWGFTLDSKPLASLIYISVLSLGFAQNLGSLWGDQPISNSSALRTVYIRTTFVLCLAVGIAAFFEYHLSVGLDPLISKPLSTYPYELDAISWNILCTSVLLFFSISYILSSILLHSHHPLARRLYVYFWNGGYLSAFSDQLWKLNRHSLKRSKAIHTQGIQTQEVFHA